VAGYGHADKHQMQLMVRALLSMSETPEPADAADALAVALCHVQVAQFRARLGAGTSRRSGTRASLSSPGQQDSLRAASRISPSRNPVLR